MGYSKVMHVDPFARGDEVFAAHMADLQRAVRGFRPVLGLADAFAPGRIDGTEGVNGVTTTVAIAYGDAAGVGPWARVETARWGDTGAMSGPLREVVRHHVRLGGDRFSDLVWDEGDTTVEVDGRPVAGRVVRAGERWWAVRCPLDALTVTVAGRDWRPDVVAVATIADVEPLLSALASRPRPPWPPVRPPQPPLPDELSGEPHRALVDAVLDNRRAHEAWMADGGPVPHSSPHYGALWAAAVRRQMALADESEPEAQRAVSSVTSHLGNLQHQAEWFRDDAALRERAIAETLIFATSISTEVSSRAAQRAWQARQGSPPGRPAERFANHNDWLAAWEAWADAHGTPGG